MQNSKTTNNWERIEKWRRLPHSNTIYTVYLHLGRPDTRIITSIYLINSPCKECFFFSILLPQNGGALGDNPSKSIVACQLAHTMHRIKCINQRAMCTHCTQLHTQPANRQIWLHAHRNWSNRIKLSVTKSESLINFLVCLVIYTFDCLCWLFALAFLRLCVCLCGRARRGGTTQCTNAMRANVDQCANSNGDCSDCVCCKTRSASWDDDNFLGLLHLLLAPSQDWRNTHYVRRLELNIDFHCSVHFLDDWMIRRSAITAFAASSARSSWHQLQGWKEWFGGSAVWWMLDVKL